MLQKTAVEPIGRQRGWPDPANAGRSGSGSVVSNRRLRKTCAVISLHSCGEVASSGCSARNSGASRSKARNCRATRAGRGVASLGRRIWIDRLPDTRRPVLGILQQQPVQEGGAAARQAGDEDRPFDLLLAECRHRALRHPGSAADWSGSEAMSQRVAMRPTRLSEASSTHAASRRRSGSMNEASPNSLSPLRRRAAASSGSASSGRRSRPSVSATPSASLRHRILAATNAVSPLRHDRSTSQGTRS